MSILHQGQPPSYQEAHILAQVQIAPMPVVAESNAEQNRGTPALITVSQASEVDPSVEEQKQSIYRHPLFPLMAMVFEKCEMASCSLDYITGTDYDKDIHSFFELSAQKNQDFNTEDEELDNLMLRAVQVLRIHLLELEKVSELCKDFCTRYITCLKGKLQSEHLLRLDDLDSPPLSPTASAAATVTDWSGGTTLNTLPTTPVVTPVGGGVMMGQGLSMATISQGQIISGNMVYQMVHTPQGIVAQPIQIQASPLQPAMGTTPVIQGTTPLSQIGVVASPVAQQPTQPAPVNLCTNNNNNDDSFDEDDPLGKKRNTKRGVLPKHATQIMRSWLFQHLVHPYPTEDEKRQIAGQTNLTLLQVNNWFINARRRILQPMLDGTNSGSGGSSASSSGETKPKKSKPVTRPQQRFWPSSIANITPQLPPHLKLPSSPTSTMTTVTIDVDAMSATSAVSDSSEVVGATPTIVTAVVTANGQVINSENGAPITLSSLPLPLPTNLILQSPPSPSHHPPLPLSNLSPSTPMNNDGDESSPLALVTLKDDDEGEEN